MSYERIIQGEPREESQVVGTVVEAGRTPDSKTRFRPLWEPSAGQCGGTGVGGGEQGGRCLRGQQGQALGPGYLPRSSERHCRS